MTQEGLDRINALARKARAEGLTEEEKAEQQSLRREYLADFRKGLEARLDNTWIVRPNGEKTPLPRKQ